MSAEIVKAGDVAVWTSEQRNLIKRTCAPDATDDELAMYLHVAKNSGLDPLRRQLHFMKHGGRVTMVADVNGLQERAAEEPDYEGIAHAVVYEKDAFEVDQVKGEVLRHTNNPFGQNGKLVGAWAIVRRKGMLPFLAMVRFDEYFSNNNPLWKSKPAVMIDKCAKSTALRLAYPKKLGGIYDRAELDKEIGVSASLPEAKGVEGLKEKLKAKAETQKASMPVAGPVAIWGEHKGKLLSGLTEAQLGGLLDEADQKLPGLQAQSSKWVGPVAASRAAILEEIGRRQEKPNAEVIDAEFSPVNPPSTGPEANHAA